ncbi:hypothetical protein ScPMuIL_009962 [Solemya velum]
MLALSSLFLVFVCVNGQTQNVDQVLSTLTNVADFYNLVKTTSTSSALQGTGPFTVFAPTGTAMHRNRKLAQLTNDTVAAGKFVQYHIVNGAYNTQDLVNELHLTSKSGILIRANHYNYRDRVTVQGSLVIESHPASNGIVHVISYYMDPPVGTLLQAVQSDPNLSTFAGLMVSANLSSVLSDDGPYTLLAPTNAAMTALTVGVLQRLQADPQIFRDTMMYHIIHGTIYAFGMHSGYLHNLGEKDRERIVNSAVFGVSIDNKRIVNLDINANNGVLHHMNGLLIPSTYRSHVLYGFPLASTTTTASTRA